MTPDLDTAQLHARLPVFDAHTDTLQRVMMEDLDFSVRSAGDPLVHRCDLPRFREGGVKAQVFAVWVDPIFLPNHAIRRGVQQVGALYTLTQNHPEEIALAQTAADVRRISAEGKLAALLSIEGGDAIENEIEALRMFHRLGASSMTLCHSRTTDWVDSSTDAPRWNGLNEFGRTVIREMNRLGMVIDVSHASDEAVREVLSVSDHPVVATHSSCRALCDHPRNLSDALLEAIAGSGGVVGINFYSGFLSQTYLDHLLTRYPDPLSSLNEPTAVEPRDLDKVARERLYALADHDVPRPPFSVLLDHIDHAVSVAGVEHVGLGSDLDVPHLSTPRGFDDVTAFPQVTAGLVARGYPERDVEMIMGGNWLRVFGQVTGS
ncbi:MAG: membrane dipeptidase [Gemmatimonadetes bacterium]|nr:membrane dipeptidase [Gemmatimonadota bacterium]